MDRIVQKAICLVVESIFEPYFEILNRSFGFRPNKGVHDAMAAFDTYYTNGMRIAIEGDVEAAFDTVVKQTLLDTLGKKIKDKKFLKFIEQRLDYDYVETIDGKQVRTRPTLGIPQGGIDSPYLFNIYMSNLDEYIEYELKPLLEAKNSQQKVQGGNLRNSIRSYKRQMKRIRPKFSEAKTSAEFESLKQEYYTCIHNIKLARHKLRNKPSIIANTRPIRIFYIKYADDWILFTNGTVEIANFIKNKISQFLSEKLKLTLSEKKTLITRITKDKAKFLGFKLKISPKGRLENKPTGNTKFTKFKLTRLFKGHVWAAPDKQRLMNRLHMKGFCNGTGVPKELPWLSCLEPQVIIQRYNSVIIGLAHFYLGYVRNRASIHRWIYILRFSCLKTLAQKYNSFNREPHKGRLSRVVQEQVVRVIKTT